MMASTVPAAYPYRPSLSRISPSERALYPSRLRARVIASGLSPATLIPSSSSQVKAAPSRRPLSMATEESSSAQNSPSTETPALPRRSLTPVISGMAVYRSGLPTGLPAEDARSAFGDQRIPRGPVRVSLGSVLRRAVFGVRVVEAELVVDLGEDAVAHPLVLLEEDLGVFAALAEALVAVGEPRAGLLDHAVLDADVEQAPLAGDTLPVHHVELDDLERRRHLVLDDLYPRLVADRVVARLQSADAPDVESNARVELQGAPAWGRLRGAEHDAYLLAQLVDKDRGGPGAVEGARELTEGLAHEPGLQADVGVTHLALYLGARHEGGNGVDDDDVEGAASDEGVGYLEGLLPVVRLGEVQVLEVHADGLGVVRVDGVLGVHEGGEASGLLGLGDDVQGQSGLPARLGAEDLDDPAAGQAPDAQSQVERERPRGDGRDLRPLVVAHPHDGSLAELPLYLSNGGVYCLALIQCILHRARASCALA